MTREKKTRTGRLKTAPFKPEPTGSGTPETQGRRRYTRRENITDWALEQFRSHCGDPSITKWDIFHYVYAVLHHPEYRQRYAANLRRELPRIPFVSACHPERSEHPASPDARESKDPVSVDAEYRPEREFSAAAPS